MVRFSSYIITLGLPLIIGITVLMSWMYQIISTKDMVHQINENNRVLTRTISNAIWSQIEGLNLSLIEEQQKFAAAGETGQSFAKSMIFTLMDEPIVELLKGTDVLHLKIYNAKNMLLYSTASAPNELSSEELYAKLEKAKTKSVSSDVVFYNSIPTRFSKPAQDRFVLNSYVPVYNQQSGKLDGILEIYNDVTKAYENLRDSKYTFASLMLVSLLTLYVIVVIMVKRLDKTISHNIELSIARDSAKNSDVAKSQFLANMSHELRTPLNAIIGYSEMISEDIDAAHDPVVHDDVLKIQSAAKHLLHLINEILDLSKIEAGQMQLFIETLDINEIIENVVQLVKPLVNANNNQFHTVIELENKIIQSDALKLRQILLNVLSNAAKFCKKGEIRLHIKLDAEMLCFEVSDTGIGMSESQIDNLFQPFVQADSSTTRQYGGTGLGLTITKQYCEMLQGSLSVKSELHVGTCFKIVIPVNYRLNISERNNNAKPSAALQKKIA